MTVAAERGLPVLAHFVDAETSAVDYVHGAEGLLMAPAYAIPRMLERNGLTLQDFDFYEIHEAFASDIKQDFNDLSSESVGVELITTSITSGGDGSDAAAEALAWNPHIKFNNDLRGYLRVDLSAQLLEARFRVVDYVSELGSSVRTRAVFGVGDGEHRLHRIA